MWVGVHKEHRVDVLHPRCLPSLTEKKVKCMPHSMLFCPLRMYCLLVWATIWPSLLFTYLAVLVSYTDKLY